MQLLITNSHQNNSESNWKNNVILFKDGGWKCFYNVLLNVQPPYWNKNKNKVQAI